jgi:autotransporter-associated beta strand protein
MKPDQITSSIREGSPFLRFLRRKSQGAFTALMLGCLAMWSTQVGGADTNWTAGSSANFLWSDANNWSLLATPTAADNAFFLSPVPNPGALPNPSIITLGAGSLANLLSFKDNYTLTGGDLALTTGGIRADIGMTATLASQITGAAGLTKTGGGAVRLTNTGNNYTGVTSISNGSLIISDAAQLGADPSAIVVTGSASRSLGGGSLVLEGGYSSGVTLARGLSLQGFGPISDRSGALNSVGTNTISGAVNSAVGAVNTRMISSSGRLTFSGGLDVAGTAGTTLSILGGALNSAGAGSYAITGALTGSGTLEKGGSGTLHLTPSTTSGFSGTVRVSSSATGTQSSVRITTANVLGSRTATATGSVIDLNGGILEVLMDTPSVLAGGAPALLYGRANTSTIFADHAPGSSVHSGTLTFGAMAFEENTTQVFAGRNGYNITVGATPVQGGNNNSTLTNNLNGGTLTFTGAFWSNTDTGGNRIMTINGNGNTTISGNITASNSDTGENHNLTKQGTGILQITSTGSTLDGNVNVQNGTVQITDFRSITNNTSTVNLGASAGNNTAATAGTLTIGTATAATAAGLITSKVLNLAGSIGGGTINANQSFAAPVILNGNLTSTALGTASYTLSGTSAQENIINGVISNGGTGTTQLTANAANGATTLTLGSVDGIAVGAAISGGSIPGGATVTAINTANRQVTISAGLTAAINGGTTITVAGVTNLTGLTKTGTGLWALSNTNTYTGATSLVGGTLRLKANAGASTVIADSSPVSLGVTGNVQNSGGTLELLGVNGVATTENLGVLSPTTGANTVTLTSGGGGAAANLVFSSLGTVANGTGTNFATAAGGGGTVTLTGVATSTATTLPGNGKIYIDGGNFARSSSGVLVAPVYGTDVGFVNAAAGAATLTSSSHNNITGNITAQTTITVSSIRISGQTLTLTGALNVNTGGVANDGGILATGGTSTITGSSVGTSGSGGLVIRVNGSSDVLNLASLIPSSTTGGLTKNGAGVLVLSGNNAQVTGATNINEGTVRLSGTGRLSGANVTTNIRSGATLDLNGVGTGTAIGQFNGGGTVTNSNATAATLQVGNNNGAGTFTGVIQNGTGIVNVSKVGTGAQTWSGVSTYTGSTTIASSGLVTVGTLADIGSDSSIGRGDSTSAATNAASLVFTGTTGGISYNGLTAASTNRLFTLNGAANGGGQIANASAVNAPLAFTNTGAIAFGAPNTAQVLTLGGASTADNTFAPLLQDNGTGRLGLTKIGGGNWVLTNASNSYTGITTVGTGTTAGGTLQAVDGSTLPANSPLLLGAGTTGGGQFMTSGDFVRNLAATPAAGTGTVTVGATTATTAGVGFAASGSKLVVSFGGIATPTALTWGSGGFMGVSGTSTGAFVLNSANSFAEIEVRNAINTNGLVRTIEVVDNGNTGADFATLTGVISGTGGINKTNTGILQLFGANTYSGATTVTSGTLTVASLGNSAVASATSVGTSTGGNLATGGITLTNNGNNAGLLEYVGVGETSDRFIQLGVASGTGNSQIHASGSGALILTNVNNTSTTASKTLLLRGSNTAGNMITSNLADNTGTLGVTVDGGATWILSGNNTQTGTLSVTAGAFGFGSNTVTGGGISTGNASLFAHGADRTIANTVTHPNNINTAYIGENNLTFSGTYANASSDSPNVITNTIVAGKSLTLNNITNNALTSDRSLTFQGTGDYNITGAVTNSTAFNLNPVFSTTGTTTLSGTGWSNWANATTPGTLTISAGTVKLGASDVIPSGSGSGSNGNLVISPAAAVTATFDLNGFNQTINGMTANSAGNIVINNSAAGPVTLTVGDTSISGASTVTFGGGAGTYTLQNTGGALALTKVGTGVANFAGTLAYTGATTATEGTLNLNSAVSSTVFDVGSSGTLKLAGGYAAPANVTSVTVAGTAGAAFTGGTLSLASNAGTPLTALSTLNLGGGAGTSWLELDVGDTGTDTLTSTVAATAANTIHFLIKDLDISNGSTYNLLTAPGGLTSGGATYNFTLAGYTGSVLNVSDTVVSLTAGTLITNDIYWAGSASPTTTMWNTIDTFGNTNFSSDLAGAIPETSLPGKGQKIIFAADTVTGGGALSTTLEQSFKVNALEFMQSTTPANTPISITIAPGAVSSNSLNVSPSSSANGLNLLTNGTPLVTVSAPFVAGADQTWNTADAVTLTSGTTVAGTTVTVADTTGLRPGMTITGSGIPAGATIASVTNGTTFELSTAATAGSGQTFYAAQQLTMSGALTGTGDITKTGAGKVLLTAASSGYTGTYFANGGVTEMTNATALSGIPASPGAGAPVSIGSGGTFYYNNGTSGTVSNDLTLNGGTLSAGGNNQTYSGDVSVSADSFITLRDRGNATPGATARNITLPGVISGMGKITLDSVNTLSAGNQFSGTLSLGGSNTGWSGGLSFNRGSVTATTVDALGTGPITATLGRITFGTAGGTTFNIPSTQTLSVDGAGSVFELTADASGTPASDMTVNYGGAITLGSAANANVGLRIFQATDNFSVINLKGGVVLANNASISVAGSSTRVAKIDTAGISETGGSRVLSINDDVGGWGQTNQTLAINAASTYTGGTILGGGTLQLGNKDAIGTGSLTVAAASALQSNTDLTTGGSGPIANAVIANAALTLSGNSNFELSGLVSGTAGIVKSGTSTVILSSANTYAGTTTINNGTLRYGINGTTPSTSAVTVNPNAAGNTATLDLNGFNGTVASLTIGGTGQTATSTSVVQTGAGTLTLGGALTTNATGNPTATPVISGNLDLGAANRSIVVANSTGSLVDLDIQAVVSGTGFGFTKTGAGVLQLSNSNTYTGTTTLFAATGNTTNGVIAATATNALGTGPVALNFNTGAVTAQLALSGGITLGNSSITTTGAGSDGVTNGIIRSVSGANSISGSLNLTGGGGSSTYRADTGSSLTVSGNIGGILGNTNRFVTLVGGGDFVFNGNITNTNDASASTVGLDVGNTGTTTVSGNNTYTLATTVQSGATLIAGSSTAFSGASAATVTGTLRLAGFSNSVGSLAGAGIVENANATAATLTTGSSGSTTFSGVIQDGTGGGALGLTKTGASTLTLSGVNTYTGITSINGGKISISADSGLGAAPGAPVANQLTLNGGSLVTSASLNLDINRGVTLAAGGGTFEPAAATTLNIAGDITGVGGLILNSSGGTLELSGTAANTYSGATTITAGTLDLNKTGVNAIVGDAIASKVTPQVVVNGGTLRLLQNDQIHDNLYINVTSGTLNFNNFNETIYNLNVSGGTVNYGTGDIVVDDPVWSGGTNTISGNTTFGFLDISGGINNVTGTGGGGAGRLTIGTLSTPGPLTFSGNNNTPTLNLNSDNATPGTLRFRAGSTIDLVFSGTGTSTGLIASTGAGSNSGQFDLNGSTRTFSIGDAAGSPVDMTISASIINSTGSAGFNKTGAGTLLLTAANTYNNTTTVSAGTLIVNNTTGSGTGTGPVTVDAGATLSGTGRVASAANNFVTINGALVVGDSSLGSPVASDFTLDTSGTGSTVLGNASSIFVDLFTGAGSGNNTAITTAADYIKLFGTLDPTLGGTLVIGNPNAMTGFAAGDMWRLFDLNGGAGSIIAALTLDYTSLGLTGGLSGSFNNSTGVFTIVGVPEPSRLVLLGLGMLGLLFRRRRQSS